jgi:hypothetical protein
VECLGQQFWNFQEIASCELVGTFAQWPEGNKRVEKRADKYASEGNLSVS